MNGSAYNDFLPLPSTTINPSSYGRKRNNLSSYLYTKFPYQSLSSVDLTSSSPSFNKFPSRVALPPSTKVVQSVKSVCQKKSTSTSVQSYLQVPSSISSNKGSLAKFAARMNCLFWFETTARLNAIENNQDPVQTLAPGVIPTLDFQNWVVTVLWTTQVSHNVILLGLMFIYRLKQSNSAIKGKSGSEFRLLTIALMLGNKILDDNSYTNKAWAKVSGIPQQEIHIMEAEFLSNVRYNLFASKDDWNGWHAKLRHFTDFYHKASPVPKDNEFVSNIPTLHFSSNLDLVSPLPPFPPPSKLPPMNGSLRVLGNCDLSVKNGDSYAPLLARLRNKIPQSVKSRKRGHDQSMDKNLVKRTAISSLPMLALPPSPAPTCMPAPTSVPSSHPMHPSQDQRHELSRPSIS